MELLQSCAKPSKWLFINWTLRNRFIMNWTLRNNLSRQAMRCQLWDFGRNLTGKPWSVNCEGFGRNLTVVAHHTMFSWLLPLRMAWNPLMVSLSGTSFPSEPVNTSATWKGWDRKREILRARDTVSLSSSDKSSIPRIAMMSCRDLWSWNGKNSD